MSRTLKRLIDEYRNDPESSFLDLQYQVRMKQDRLLARISREHGSNQLRNIRARTLMAWYRIWLTGGKIAASHKLISQLRVLFRFGFTMRDDTDCGRLLDALSKIRLQNSEPRTVQMSADHANSIRMTARERFGWPSMALAQALQFELLMSQKDVIGEWVPESEPGISNVRFRGQKWLRGLRWSDIDKNMVLRHSLGKSRRRIEVDLRTAPMVMEELALLAGVSPELLTRDMLPATGPVITNEINALPWSPNEFRRKWRKAADAAGLPKEIKNTDSLPSGMMVGGPDRARVSQTITAQMISYSMRMLRR
jgi:hypothetical protein